MEWWAWILLGLLLFPGGAVTTRRLLHYFLRHRRHGRRRARSASTAGPSMVSVCSVLRRSRFLPFGCFVKSCCDLTQRRAADKCRQSGRRNCRGPLETLPLNAMGKAEMRGTSWTARNIGEKPLARGERCTVERIEGLTIFIRAEQTETEKTMGGFIVVIVLAFLSSSSSPRPPSWYRSRAPTSSSVWENIAAL